MAWPMGPGQVPGQSWERQAVGTAGATAQNLTHRPSALGTRRDCHSSPEPDFKLAGVLFLYFPLPVFTWPGP